jgi:putative ATPase
VTDDLFGPGQPAPAGDAAGGIAGTGRGDAGHDAVETRPLAARLRPLRLDDVVGQRHLLASGAPLRRLLEAGRMHSMLLWGPPGVGKTTLARLVADHFTARFVALSAVSAGIRDIRDVVAQARAALASRRRTVLFLDEVHRFNRAQQDALLPHVEDGTLTLIGATTENPSFEVNGALLSRVKVYRLLPLDDAALEGLLCRALDLLGDAPRVAPGARRRLRLAADGDGRRLLNLLEVALPLARDGVLDETGLDVVLQGDPRRFDKGGDLFHDHISALHKSVRGSQPDAALYWLARMLGAGCDPLFVARRVLRIASEDVGLADPAALRVAIDAWDVYARLGSPEGELAIAQAVVYLATAPKSDSVYTALGAVRDEVERTPSYEVPMHLRNAPTALLASIGAGRGYRHAHDEAGHYAAGEWYLPPELVARRYYEPGGQGHERVVRARLEHWRRLDAAARAHADPGAVVDVDPGATALDAGADAAAPAGSPGAATGGGPREGT